MTGDRILACVGEGLFELGLVAGADELEHGYGGDVANVAVMAARLGCRARLGGRVGDDPLGRRLLAFWRAVGVDTTHVVVDDVRPTGLYVNELDADGHRFTYLRRDSAGSRLAAADLGVAFLCDIAVLHVSGITLAVSETSAHAAAEAVARARQESRAVSLAANHRPALGGDPRRIAAMAHDADYLFASEDEASTVFDVERPEELADAYPNAEVVVTAGPRGAVVARSGDRRIDVRAPSVAAVDAAGAGDALTGAYLASRLAGSPPARALQIAVTAAALSCERRGCARSYPSRSEVEEALR